MSMNPETQHMGRDRKVTKKRVLELMENADRPVWTATVLAEQMDTSRTTASKRLKELENQGEVDTVEVANATAYYRPGIEMKSQGDHVEAIKRDLRGHFEDRFIGLSTAPWETGTEKPVEPGDRVQIQVDGKPGQWSELAIRAYENRRKELTYDETIKSASQALITGTVYEKPTTPIEHTDYPDDYDLEGEIRAEYRGDPPHQALVAVGFKNHLIKPANDAKFIRDVEVEWLSPEEQGEEIPEHGFEEVAEPVDPDAEWLEEWDPEEHIQPTYADIVQLPGDETTPRRAYIEERGDGGFQVIPADFEGNQLTDYEPTDRFKQIVRRQTIVDGPLHFGRGESDE